MSPELIGIIAVGIVLAGLILVGANRLKADIKRIRTEFRDSRDG